mgnify:CR=1 FL=1
MVGSEPGVKTDAPLQLLLFVDKRPRSWQQSRSIRRFLHDSAAKNFALQVVDVGEQPYLAEHFKLVATPTLIKLRPGPQQTLAGSNLLEQLQQWWPRWQKALEEDNSKDGSAEEVILANDAIASAEFMELSEEIFRLKRDNAELQAQIRFKDRLVAILAHDLRNPLTSTSIALETLEALGKKRESGKSVTIEPSLFDQLIGHARTQTKAIERMVFDLLESARSRSGQLEIHPQCLDLRELCKSILDNLRDRIDSKDQHLKTDVPQDLPDVYADEERIRQVLANLLDNAMKYTPEGGQIELSVLHRTAYKVQVSVCDNGPGIPPDKQKCIFDDRFRLERDETTEGYGIGLFSCQRIVRAHYGQIWVNSEANKGSCFHFTLPVF